MHRSDASIGYITLMNGVMALIYLAAFEYHFFRD